MKSPLQVRKPPASMLASRLRRQGCHTLRGTLTIALLSGAAAAQRADDSDERALRARRLAMVERHLASEGIKDAATLSAMRTVPRHEFVPAAFRDEACENHPLPIGHGQTISQPYIVAYMTEIVRPRPGMRILEVGTAGALALCAGGLLGLVHLLQPTPLALRGTAAFMLLAPVAAAMGMLFPLGLRALPRGERGAIAWAWAVNGFASTVAVPLAALIAVEGGSRVLLLGATTAYAVAAASARGTGGASKRDATV